MGSRAANKAAQIQQQAAQQAAQGMQGAFNQYNPAIGTTAAQAAADMLAATGTAGANLTGAAGQAGQGLTGAAGQAAQGITGAAGEANALLAPYLQAGGGAAQSLAELMAPGGALTKQFTAQDMQTLDPGYQFRMDQASKALQASAAARGGALGGGALQSLANLNQNLASSEMQNAFNRFQAQQQDRYQRLYGLAGMGQQAAGTSGANLLNAAQQAGNWGVNAAQQAGNWGVNAAQQAGNWGLQGAEYGGNAQQQAAQLMAQNALGTQRSIADLMTGGAAAQAAGTMGSANAWGGALGGVANAAGQVGNYYNQQQMLNRLMGGGYGNPSTQTLAGLPGRTMPNYMNPLYGYVPPTYAGASGGSPMTYGPFAPYELGGGGYLGTYGGYKG
jgi:hypothetical protein